MTVCAVRKTGLTDPLANAPNRPVSAPTAPSMLLRTIAPAADASLAPVPLRPEEVPAQVDDALLARTLRHGRPLGNETIHALSGVACPVISKGAGAPLLFVHGLGHDSWDWAPLFVRCSKTARCVSFDLPGFGLSDKPALPPSGRWDLRVHVDALLQVAEHILQENGQAPVVVASSLGGHLAILAALEQPALFHKLALLSPGGLVDAPKLLQASVRAYYTVDAIASRPEAEILHNSRRIFAIPGNPLDDQLAARKLAVRRSLRAHEFAVPFSGVVDDVFRHVVIRSFPQLRVPVLLISGEKDVVVPAAACAEPARRLGCRFELLHGIGHCPHLEHADALADMLLAFASAQDSTPERTTA
jgi:pimeloyl-ACP methyl ester carboxylesterase